MQVSELVAAETNICFDLGGNRTCMRVPTPPNATKTLIIARSPTPPNDLADLNALQIRLVQGENISIEQLEALALQPK
jgi:hypothetical protein